MNLRGVLFIGDSVGKPAATGPCFWTINAGRTFKLQVLQAISDEPPLRMILAQTASRLAGELIPSRLSMVERASGGELPTISRHQAAASARDSSRVLPNLRHGIGLKATARGFQRFRTSTHKQLNLGRAHWARRASRLLQNSVSAQHVWSTHFLMLSGPLGPADLSQFEWLFLHGCRRASER